MMRKKHQPTTEELYRARKQREEEEKDANLPPGLINHGNTCFMNSTLQGLMATGLLHNLVYFEPLSSSLQERLGGSIVAHRSPQLTNGHGLAGQYEQSRVEGMPLGDVFIGVMRKAWDIQQGHRRESMSPKELLFTIGGKYDQYLDFRQQDAHEFLRHMLDAMRMEELDIIKKRQPPPPKAFRKRSLKRRISTTITPAASSSTSNLTSNDDIATPPESDVRLESFVDMLFGGHLASILVCEKCKKVSLTYEEFNDLSLSIKPEDYVKGRKRDRFKRLARKLRGPFRSPGVEGGDRAPMHRSSSVPADRARRSAESAGHEEPPENEGPRRRSFEYVAEEDEDGDAEEARDVVGAMPQTQSPVLSPADDAEASPSADEDKDKEKGLETGKEKDKEKDKKDREDAWGRFGRRLSVSVKKGMKALDPGSPGRSIERGRKVQVQPQDQTPVRRTKDGERDAHKEPRVNALRLYESGSEAGESSDASPHLRFASPLPVAGAPSPLSNPPISAPSRPSLGKRGTALGSRHKKSPHAPKPTKQEAAYLRQLLADIHTSTANPFSVLHQALAGAAHGTPPSAAAQAAWAKMGHLPGIEECLRMFTAVEILDGENMVGCHRCWKIAHGKYKPRRQKVAEKDDDRDAEHESTSSTSPSEKQDEEPKSEGTAEPPVSASAESLSSSPEQSNSGRISPASTSAIQTSSVNSLSDHMSDSTSMTAPTTIGSFPSSGDKAELPLIISPTRPTTYGGLPIPSISTTAPESPVGPKQTPHDGGAQSDPYPTRPHSPLGASPSSDSLLTPRRGRLPKLKADRVDEKSESSDETDGSDSDVSASTSVFSDASSLASAQVSPGVSPRASVDNLHSPEEVPADRHEASSGEAPSVKISRSKQVILRRMYKRYLIADPPPILVVHLKRFQQTSKTYTVSFTGGVKKLDEFVAFPEYLDLAPFLAPRRQDFGLEHQSGKYSIKESRKDTRCMYRLYAVVVHIGNMLGGHYIAYTALPSGDSNDPSSTQESTPSDPNNPSSGSAPSSSQTENAARTQKPQRQWAYISDTVVRLTTIEEVLKAKAYICMYERI